ncbi:flavin reductase [Tessaracoccus caeni]|uniref:flavin reductase n=1 Tax=Tessaracoccus caeni TaxID=3031239 RepID=UPI0023D9F3C0|nr:flavin reductase [Tessaracoccus caeni]MDF1489612.1 flavin reductase [Tessaracoccus caeni]
MTIHHEHPFLPPPGQREPARRLRSLLPSPVSVWASGSGTHRDGWTISSMLVANGEPAELVALIDEDCDWWDLFQQTGLATVNVLGPGQGPVSDAFARLTPSPGGPFRTGTWSDTEHGPKLAGAAAWAGVSLITKDPEHSGWGLLVRVRLDWIEVADGVPALEHRSGRYL